MALTLDRIASGASIVSSAYLAAGIPQPLLRERPTMRVPQRALGAGIESASIGARSATFVRRVDSQGLDLDLLSCYAVANALAGAQDFLTHEVVARHTASANSSSAFRALVERSVAVELLEHPGAWRDLARLVKVRPAGDVLTTHVELVGTEATVTAPIVTGSQPFWTTGFDLAVAAIENEDAGGPGRVPDVVESWTFTFGDRLPRLRAVSFPEGWRWDPRRASTYRSRDGKTWGHLPLLLSAMRISAKRDPDLTPPAMIRRRGVLKIATVAASFGMFSATSERADVRPGERHRVITSDGVVSLASCRAERPGPWAFPPAAALVEGAGRLLLTLLMHEVRATSGLLIQVDTDGAYVGALFSRGAGR